MRIEDNRGCKSMKEFNDIREGECFEFHDKIFIKTYRSCSSSINALSLEDNTLNIFGGKEIVKPINARVVIEENEVES